MPDKPTVLTVFHLFTLLLAQIAVADALFKETLLGTLLYFCPESVGRQSPASRSASGVSLRVTELACVFDSHWEEVLSFATLIPPFFSFSLMLYVTKPSLADIKPRE